MVVLEKIRILTSEIFLTGLLVIPPTLVTHLNVSIVVTVTSNQMNKEDLEDNAGIGAKDNVTENIVADLNM